MARTIESVDGVSGASVSLVLPDEQLFAEEDSPAKAAVVLQNDASSLEPGAVRGIAQVVASGVKGLKLDQVSITDSTGALLWPNGEGGAGGGSTATGKQAAERRYSGELEAKLNGLLTQTIGPGKGQVQVNADLNVDEATKDELAYAEKAVPGKTKTETEELQGGGGGGSAAGAAGNIPSYAGGAGGGGNSNYKRETEETENLVGKTVTRTKVAPGKVEKLNVSLLVDKSVPPADLQELETAVTAAAGIQPERGDVMSTSQVAFTKAEAEKPSAAAGMIGYAKYLALGIASLLFLFFITRHLKKREGEALPEPTWLREIAAPVPLAQLEAAHAAPMQVDNFPAKTEMEQVASQNPEMVAQQIRGWMSES
jgi:flagellar M-ring protein FliF